jgi:general secretion pathway protein G
MNKAGLRTWDSGLSSYRVAWCFSLSPKSCVLSPRVIRAPRGFTLIELLVVMAIIATLLTLAVPRYFHSTDRAKEAVLKQNLAQMRESIDKYYGDRGRYPDSLDDLVSRKYLRKIPPDPITDSALTWVPVPPDLAGSGGVFDVRSGAPGPALDGSGYDKW